MDLPVEARLVKRTTPYYWSVCGSILVSHTAQHLRRGNAEWLASHDSHDESSRHRRFLARLLSASPHFNRFSKRLFASITHHHHHHDKQSPLAAIASGYSGNHSHCGLARGSH